MTTEILEIFAGRDETVIRSLESEPADAEQSAHSARTISAWVWMAQDGVLLRFGREGDVVVTASFSGSTIGQDIGRVARLSDARHPGRWWTSVGDSAAIAASRPVGTFDEQADGSVWIGYRGPLFDGEPESGAPPFRIRVGPNGVLGWKSTPPEPTDKTEPYLMGIDLEIDPPRGECPLPPRAVRTGSVFIPGSPSTISESRTEYTLRHWNRPDDIEDTIKAIIGNLRQRSSIVFDQRSGIGYSVGGKRARVDGVDHVVSPPEATCGTSADLLDRLSGETSESAFASVVEVVRTEGHRPPSAGAIAAVGPTSDGKVPGDSGIFMPVISWAAVLGGLTLIGAFGRKMRGERPGANRRRRLSYLTGGVGVAALGIGLLVSQPIGDGDIAAGGVIDLGTVASGPNGAEASKTVRWRNASSQAVHIEQIVTDCSCLHATASAVDVDAGDSIDLTFHMVLARPEVRAVGATMVFSGADPIRWTVKGEGVGRGAIHSLLHDHSLVVGKPGRYDLLVLGAQGNPPRVRLEVPEGVVGRFEGARLLAAAPQPTASRSGSPDESASEGVSASDAAHWHFRFTLTAESACRLGSDPSWRPYGLKGVLDDGRVVTDWFVLQDK